MNNPPVFNTLLAPLLPLLSSEAAQLKEDDKYSLSLYRFTLNLCYAVIIGIRSISILVTDIKTSAHTEAFNLTRASKSMYSEAFLRYDPIIFKRIFMRLLESTRFIPIPELQALGRLMLVDGSLFPAIKTMDWATYKKDAQALKLHLVFELNRMIPVQFISTDANASERNILASVLEVGVTYIADRGYLSFDLFALIHRSSAFFIIRIKSNMVYTPQKTFDVSLPESWKPFLGKVTDCRIIFDNAPKKVAYRLVSFEVLEQTYYIVTNRFDLKTHEIIMLYAYRWQIELFFRCLKRTLNGLHLWSQDSRGIEIQFYIYMIAYVLLLSFKQNMTQWAEELEDHGKEQGKQCSKPIKNNAADRPHCSRIPVCGLVTLLGEKLKKTWKISLHWLVSLRNLLIHPMNTETIKLIANTS